MKAAVLFALALAAGTPAMAQDAPAVPNVPNRFAASIAPAERFEVGGMLVERHGQRGRPLVLIPGLASGPWVWQDLIRRFKDERTLYVVTVPGFDGRPAASGASFESVRAALKELITARRLDKPVLVGHSMGGTLALAVAQDLPGAVGGVISIDGLPVFPGTEDLPLAQRPQFAASIRSRMDAAPQAAYAEQQRQYMRTQGVVDMGKADDLAVLALRSDRGAVGSYMADLFALDLRPGLAKITAPVLVLVPYFEPDASQDQVTSALKVEHYRRLMAGTAKLEMAPVPNARHFLMIDQPDALAEAVRRFINRP
ncbi:alpha/beta fold hydrolase [Telluria aromaticivorans]|uniref:Alpha/beta hydrolase n=1 Tax=Telluria aromaticivorans TaxID=2725995 RepID=A0A7Y2P2L6_9BURK|nr:alpha/beta hydrolase [Telluria aromaticivorans]NNG25766.1 alpha/beta hydrolase [Telluria aromaticivorans]